MKRSVAHPTTAVSAVFFAVLLLVFSSFSGTVSKAGSRLSDVVDLSALQPAAPALIGKVSLLEHLFAYSYHPVAIPLTVFTNSANIAIPDDGINGVTSTIAVSGTAGPISSLTLTLNNLTTPRPQNLDFLLVGPGGQKFIFLSDAGGQNAASATSNVTMTFDDASGVVILQASNTPFTTGTFRPVDYDASVPFPTAAGPYQSAAPFGSATFGSIFGGLSGASVNGNWVLHAFDSSSGGGTSQVAGGWSLNIVTAPAAAATTTTLGSSANPSFTNQAITLTSTTTSSSTVNTGNVNFVDNTTSVTLCSNVPVNGSGMAACVVPANTLTERAHQITATYIANATFATSNGSLVQEVNNPTQISGTMYTNPGTVTVGDAGFATVPYPSNIFVTGLSGTISKVTVTLQGVNFPETGDLDFLLVGPGGQKYVFWSDAGGGSSASTGTFVLDDAGASQLPSSGSIAAGTYRPADYAVESDTFPAPAPAGPYSAAGPNGSSTFASVFGGAAPNGKWSLYVTDDSGSGGITSSIAGWKLTFTTSSDAPTTTTLTSSPNPATTAQAIGLTATVTSTSTVNAGTVTFRNGGTILCATVPVNGSGVATCNVPAGTLAQGTHTLTADYNGSPGQFNISSGTTTQQVNSPTVVSCLNFANNGGITVSNAALGNPYPSNISVSGLAGSISKLTLTMTIGNAPTPDHTDFLLVGPGGQKFIFMSDAGGTVDVINQTLTFDDAAASALPDSTAIVSGTYRPTAYPGDVDAFPAPAPAAPYNSAAPEGAGTFAVFNGISPNGSWSLYATEDAGDGADTLITNWSLDFVLAATATTTTVTSSANPSVFGQPVTFTATVTPNSGTGIPSGNVQFFDGATPIGAAVALNGAGQAQVTTSALTGGSHTITAQYAGVSGACTGSFSASTGTLPGGQQVSFPPTFTKAFGAASVPLNGTTSLTFTLSNPNAAGGFTGVGFTDTLVSGLVVATLNNLSTTCAGTASAVAGSSTISLSGGTLAANSSCTLTVNVTGTSVGTKPNSATLSTTEIGANSAATGTVNLVVAAPPTVSKSFVNPAQGNSNNTSLNGTARLSIAITNPPANPISLSGLAISDSFPTGMEVDASPSPTNTCGGTFAPVAGATSISFSGGGPLTPGNQCVVSVVVKATQAGALVNTTGNVSSTEGGTGGTASGTLNVFAPPTITKAFGASSIAPGGQTTLTLTISNPAGNPGNLTGVSVDDNFPAGLVAGTPPLISTTNCGGSIVTDTGGGSFGAGDTGIRVSNATAVVGTPCVVVANVTSSTPGVYNNTTDAITSTNGGTGAVSNTATLNVNLPPTVSKAFSPTSIISGNNSTLTITLSNPNPTTDLTGAALTDTLPAGVTTVPATAATTCGGSATQASGSVSLTGGTIPQGGSCTLTVSVTSTVLGPHTNTIAAGGLATANGGSNSASASAVLTVLAPPPTLGTYPNTTIDLSGNTTVMPSATPQSTARMTVNASTYFKGTLEADPLTGIVRITNAFPAGTHLITVTAFNADGVSVSKTFNLTVTTPASCNPVAFTSAENFGVGTSPLAVAVGDVNGDGVQDLVTANSGSANVSVLLGDGFGGYAAAISVAAGASPRSVAIADLNRDGIQDLAVANFLDNNVSVLLGNGLGGFGAATNFAVGSGPTSVAVGDFNNDQIPDLAAANLNSSNVSVLIGNGAGGFAAAVNAATGGAGPTALVIGDFNNDNNSDVATSNAVSGNASVMLGNGSGGFGTPVTYPVGTNPASITAADLDGDGDQDLAVANADSGNVSVLRGNNSGGFAAAVNFVTGPTTTSVATGDFNADGIPDLAVGVAGTDSVAILLANGSGGYLPAANFGTGVDPFNLAVGDFDQDGRQDIAAVNSGSNDVSVLLRQCAPTITGATVARQEGSPVSASQIATVGDAEQPANTLAVTVNGGASATVNGVTVSGIMVDNMGVVSANVVAACGATNAAFTLEVKDSENAAATATLTVNVTPNTAPVLGTYQNTGTLPVGGGTMVTPSAPPTDNGSISTLTASAPGFTGALSTNPTTGVVTVTNAGPSGIYTVTVTATDNCGAISTATFQLTVNSPPAITPATPLTRTQGAPPSVSQIATVSDPDQPANTLAVTVNGGSTATVNGVTVSGISVNAAGQVSATVGAACAAASASFTLRVTDSLGAFMTATLTVNVLNETTPPVINPIANVVATLPNGSATSMPVTFPLPTATDNCGSVTVTTNPVSGSIFAVGTTVVNVTATDSNGNVATATFTVTVRYPFTGFTGRVYNPPATNFAQAGNTIPISFSLNGDRGLNIFAPGSPSSQQVNCGSGAPVGASVPAISSPSLVFFGGQYTFYWATDPAWAGTCRVFTMTFKDGTSKQLNFSFYN